MHITKRIEDVELKIIVEDIFENDYEIFVIIVRVDKYRHEKLKNVHILRRVQINEALVENKFKSNFKIFVLKILKTYHDIDSENKIYEFAKYIVDDYTIELVDEKQSSHNSIYSIFEIKLKILKVYLDKYLANKYIRFFKLSIDISILFIRKKNDSLRLYINYKDLNTIIIKNKYSLSLIKKNLNRLNCAKRFTSLNLTTIYYRIRIKRDNE